MRWKGFIARQSVASVIFPMNIGARLKHVNPVMSIFTRARKAQIVRVATPWTVGLLMWGSSMILGHLGLRVYTMKLRANGAMVPSESKHWLAVGQSA